MAARTDEIRRAAAREVVDEATSLWLLWDEAGTWERRIETLLQQTAERAETLKLNAHEVDAQIGILIAAEALEAIACACTVRAREPIAQAGSEGRSEARA